MRRAFAGREVVQREAQHRAAVVVAGLVKRDAAMLEGLVHFESALESLSVVVGDDDVAGVAARHSGRVVVDVEAFEFDFERQFLQQDAVFEIEHREVGARAFGYIDVAAIAPVAGVEPRRSGNVGDGLVAVGGRFAGEAHLQRQRQVAVEQAAEADEHDGAVGEKITDAPDAAALGGDEDAVVAFVDAETETGAGEVIAHRAPARFRRQGRRQTGAVGESAQRRFAGVFAEAAHLVQHRRELANDAQRRRQHEEGEDGDEPAGVIDGVKPQFCENRIPELSELVEIGVRRLVLLHHGADDRGDRQHGEQTDGEAHRAQKFYQRLQHGGARVGALLHRGPVGSGNEKGRLAAPPRHQGSGKPVSLSATPRRNPTLP